MRKIQVALAMAVVAITGISSADTYVRGYTKADGTYVAPHYQTAPNDTKLDNYSTKGNVNPYTGQPGDKKPYDTAPNSGYAYKPYEYRSYRYGDK